MMDSETVLLIDIARAEYLIDELRKAIANVRAGDDLNVVKVILEQAEASGPWRLILSLSESE